MRTKKALILVENSFIPLDTRVWSEATSLRDAGWQVTVVCPEPSGAYAKNLAPISFGEPVDLEGVKVYYFPINAAKDDTMGFLKEYTFAFARIAILSWRIWRDAGFDVLHICNPPDMFFPLAWFYRLCGVKIIFDHHDLFPEFILHRYPGFAGKWMYGMARAMEFLTFQCSNLTISTNESYRKIAMTRGRLAADRLTVVRNGPKVCEFTSVAPVPPLKRGLHHLVCYIGVMGHEDGIREMMEAIRYIIHDLARKDIQFTLIGDGSLRPLALERIASWGLSDQVDMPGMIRDRLLIRQYLSTADVCLSPEPLSPLNAKSTFIKVGEYMAIGKPVVAFDLEETRWTAQDAAVYVAPGDTNAFGQAIVDLIDDPERRCRMGGYGKERISDQLCWEQQQVKLIRAYESLIQKDRQLCQTASIPHLGSALTYREIGPISPPLQIKLLLKRLLSPSTKRKLKTRYIQFLNIIKKWVKAEPQPVAREQVESVTFQPGDMVRIRSREEIESTLDSWGELKGCGFMDGMADYCGTVQRVWKPVRRFVDERDYKVKKTRGVYLLEELTCRGTKLYGSCDRSCFFFWREEWLENVDEDTHE